MDLSLGQTIHINETNFWNWPGWTVIVAVTTLLYTFFTYRLLLATKKSIDIANDNKIKANKLAEFQIYTKIADSVNLDKAIELIASVGAEWFDIEEIADRSGIVAESPPIKILKGSEIQRYILNPLEDLAKFKGDDLISISSINSGFGSLILMIGGSKLIVDYIKYQQTKVYKSNSIYSGIESLVEDIIKQCPPSEQSKYINYFKQ
jgi:hypothetical protein